MCYSEVIPNIFLCSAKVNIINIHLITLFLVDNKKYDEFLLSNLSKLKGFKIFEQLEGYSATIFQDFVRYC